MKKIYPMNFLKRRFVTLMLVFTAMAVSIHAQQDVPCGNATQQQSPVFSGVCLLCNVQNASNAVDGNPNTYSTINATVSGLGYYGQLLQFGNLSLPGDSISVIVEVPGSALGLQLLQSIRLQTYNGSFANTSDTFTAANNLVRTQPLGDGTNKFRISFAARQPYTGVSVSINGAVGLLSSLRVYESQSFVPPPKLSAANGVKATGQESPIFSGVCVLCSVSNPLRAVDGDTATYSTITTTLGVAGYTGQLLKFPTNFKSGDSISFLLQTPGQLADVQLLGDIRVETYTGSTPNGNPQSLGDIARLQLLNQGGDIFRATFAANQDFDGVVVSITGVASIITNLRVFDAAVTYSSQNIFTTCSGSSALLQVSSPSNATINWYTSSTGGSSVHTGAVFTTPPVTETVTYYAEATRNGCINPNRTSVTVTGVVQPAAPVFDPSVFNTCLGDTLRLTFSGSTLRWYTSSSGGTAFFEGDTLLLSNIINSATYYAESFTGSCVSGTRTPVMINAGVLPGSLTVTPAAASINYGQSASFTASSSGTGTVYNWYTQPAGGMPAFTGAGFTTPALISSTTYYLEAVSATGCSAEVRTAVPVTVTGGPNSNMPCDGATSQRTEVNGICIGCGVTAAPLAMDSDTTTASRLTVTAGLVGGYVQQTLVFPFQGQAGDTVKIGLHFPTSLININPLSSLQVASYNGIIYNNDQVTAGGSSTSVSLFGGGTDAQLSFVPQAAFDRIELRLNSGLAGLLTDISVRYAVRIKPALTAVPAQDSICTGQSVAISITAPLNTIFRWYDAPVGGNLLFTGSNYTTPTLTSNTTYYIASVSNTGCESSLRTGVTITVATAPLTPIISGGDQQVVCSGNVTTISVQNPDPALTYTWYTSADGGIPIATGSVFTTGILTADTIFYVSAANGAGCSSTNRKAIGITVNPQLDAPALQGPSANVCAGTSAVLTVINPQNSYTYNWYTTASGGIIVATGSVFNTPVLTSTITYYAEAVNGPNCSSSRTPVTITVNPALTAPTVTINPASGNVSAGTSAVLTVNNPEAGAIYNWYAESTGGAPIHTGISFTTPAISQSVTYYAEAVSAEGCASISRTSITLTVTSVINLDCDAPTSQVTAINGLCVGCNVSNGANAVDADTSTFSQLNMTVALLGANLSQTLIFPGLSETGDSLTVVFEVPPGIAAINVSGAIELETFNGGTSNNDVISLNNPLVRLIATSGDKFVIKYAPTSLFDRIRITSNGGLVAAFNYLRIYYASRQVTPPIPTASVVNVCAGNPATLSVQPPTGVTIRWYTVPTGGSIVATGNSFTIPVVNNSITYYAEATRTSNGCVNTTRVPVIVAVVPASAIPVVTDNDIDICSGNTAVFSIANPINGIVYRWYDAPIGGNMIFEGIVFTTPALTANTMYYAGAINSTGCTSSARTEVTATVIALPVKPVITGNASICSGGSTLLSITAPEAGTVYTWYRNADGGTPVFVGIDFVTPLLSDTTSYYVLASNATGCVNDGGRTEVVVRVGASIPAPVVTATSIAVCLGTVATAAIQNPVADAVYNWYNAPTGGNLLSSGSIFTTPSINTATSYYVEAVIGSCVSVSRTEVAVQPTAIPTPPTVPNNNVTSCIGTAATLSVQAEGGMVYRWFDALTGGNLLFVGENFTTPTLTTSITYYVEAVNSTGCASARTAVAVTVNVRPTPPSVVPQSIIITAGSTVTLSIADPQPSVMYNWYDAPTDGNLLATGISFTTGNLYTDTAFYAAALSNTGCNSAFRTLVAITVGAPPQPPLVTGNNQGICAGSSATLSIVNPEVGVTYNWYDASIGGNLLFTSPIVTTPILETNTTYYVEAVQGGIVSTTRTTVPVIVNPRPVAPTITPLSIEVCSGTAVRLMIADPQTGHSYNWYITPVGGTPIFSGSIYDIVSPINGVYYADAVSNGCASLNRGAASVAVLNQLQAPVVTLGERTETSLTFTWNAIDNATEYEISIDGGNNFSTPSSGATGLSHTISGLQPGTTVTLRVRALGINACQASSLSTAVTATTGSPQGDVIFIPNAFTPNGDGKNDRFRPYGNLIAAAEIWVYSQWGHLLYHTKEGLVGWDGTAAGKLQPAGVYVFTMKITLQDNSIVNKQGSLNLIR